MTPIMTDVLGLGAVAVDELIFVPQYPVPDAKVRVERVERQCGGLTATALVTAARLGSTSAYAGVLGTDDLSEFAIASLDSEKVDLSQMRRESAARPIHSFIVVDTKRATRNIFADDQ